jgi:hypothetical protein
MELSRGERRKNMSAEDLMRYYGRVDIEISDVELFKFELNADMLTANVKLSDEVVKDSLTQIVIPYECEIESQTYLVSRINGNMFNSCENLTSVVIPNTITSIGSYAFQKCYNLTQITIPNSVTSISDYMFSWCINLKEINIPNTITSIGEYSFHRCENLTEVIIPDSVMSIGFQAFYNCINLKKVVIGNGITNISYAIFKDCEKLIDVRISNNVKTIERLAFCGCTSLIYITIPESVVNIEKKAFADCVNLKNIIIPNNVKSIGEATFENCKNLKWIKFSKKLTVLNKKLFNNCKGLEVILIPENIKEIEADCFLDCVNLNKIIIEGEDLILSDYFTTIFPNNDNLEIFANRKGSFKDNEYYANKIKFWDKYDGLYYYSSDEVCRLIYYDYNIIGGSILLFISDIKNNGLKKEIDRNAFLGCTELKMVEINENITVKSGTFENCVNLTDVFINTSSVTLENQVFPVNNPNFTIYVDSRSDLVQYKELQPYLYLLKTKKTLYNEQLFIAGVGEVELFNNNDIVLTSKTLIDTSINLTVNLEDIQANGGAKLYGKYASQAGMSLKLTEAMFRMEFLAANIGSEIEIGGSAVTSEMSIVENGVVKIDGTPLPLYLGSDKIFVWINAQGDNRGSLVFSNENIQEGENTDYGKTIINGVDLPNGTQVCVKYFESYEAGQTIKVSSNYLPDEMTAVLTAPLFAGDQNNLESAMKVGVLTITIPRLMLNGNSDISMNMTGYSQMNIEGQALAVEESECDEGGYYAIISKVIKNGSWTSNLAGIAIDNANHLKKGDILQVFGVFYGVGTRPLTRERYFVLPSNTIDERGIVTYSSDKDLLFTIILKDDNSKFTHGIVEGS